MIVVITKVRQLPFEISGTPERDVIQQLSPYSSNQSLDEGVWQWHMRYGFDLAHIKDAQIHLPTMKLKRRVVVAAKALWQCRCAGDHTIKHAAEGAFGPDFRRLGVKSNRYLRFTNAR